MKGLEQQNICPQCGAPKMKNWEDLTDDEKFLVERLPLNTEFSSAQRKKHRFCKRCWFEDPETKVTV